MGEPFAGQAGESAGTLGRAARARSLFQTGYNSLRRALRALVGLAVVGLVGQHGGHEPISAIAAVRRPVRRRPCRAGRPHARNHRFHDQSARKYFTARLLHEPVGERGAREGGDPDPTTPGVPSWENPENFAGFKFRDPVAAARKWVAHLRTKEPGRCRCGGNAYGPRGRSAHGAGESRLSVDGESGARGRDARAGRRCDRDGAHAPRGAFVVCEPARCSRRRAGGATA